MRETTMKKNIILLFALLAFLTPSLHAITERETSLFFADLLAAQYHQEAFNKVLQKIKNKPDFIHVRGQLPDEGCRNLSAAHVAVYQNQGDGLGTELLRALNAAGVNFNALSAPSPNAFDNQLSPLAFLLKRQHHSNVDSLMPILIGYGASTAHASVQLAMRFFKQFNIRQQTPPSSSLFSSDMITPASFPLVTHTRLKSSHFYDLSLPRQLRSFNIKDNAMEIICALPTHSERSLKLEKQKISSISSQIMLMVFAGMTSPLEVFKALRELIDLDHKPLIEKSILATLCYLSPGFPTRLSPTPQKILSDNIVTEMATALGVSLDTLNLYDLLTIPSHLMNRASVDHEDVTYVVYNTKESPLKELPDHVNKVLNNIISIEFSEDHMAIECEEFGWHTATRYITILNTSYLRNQKEGYWGVLSEKPVYKIQSRTARIKILNVLLGKTNPMLTYSLLSSLRDSPLGGEKGYMSLLNEICLTAGCTAENNIKNFLSDDVLECCAAELDRLGSEGSKNEVQAKPTLQEISSD